MRGLVVSWALLALAFFLTTRLVPGIHVTGGFLAYFVTALVFGLVNGLLGPVVRIATLPIRMLTLGLFGIVINIFLLLLVAHFVPELTIDGILPAVVGALVLAIVTAVLNLVLAPILRSALGS